MLSLRTSGILGKRTGNRFVCVLTLIVWLRTLFPVLSAIYLFETRYYQYESKVRLFYNLDILLVILVFRRRFHHIFFGFTPPFLNRYG